MAMNGTEPKKHVTKACCTYPRVIFGTWIMYYRYVIIIHLTLNTLLNPKPQASAMMVMSDDNDNDNNTDKENVELNTLDKQTLN